MEYLQRDDILCYANQARVLLIECDLIDDVGGKL